jgi:hypothetical protein
MYQILTRYYNKNGINDGVNYQVVNDRLQVVSNHRVKKRAEEAIRKLNNRG